MSEAEPMKTGSAGADVDTDSSSSAGAPDPDNLPASAFSWIVEDYIKPTAVQMLIYAAKNPWDFVYTIILCLAPFFAISAYLSYR